MKKISVGIIGATGYVGVELIRLLLDHPLVEIVAIGSKHNQGVEITTVYPMLEQLFEQTLIDDFAVIDKSDVIFISLPHGLSQKYAAAINQAHKICIDLGADFRLDVEAVYTKWYDGKFLDKALQERAVYGLPEINRCKIRDSLIIANPGCYPTAISLGLAPIITKINRKNIIIDAKSGITGAGKSLSEQTHFANCSDGFGPYNVGMHRHTPEIEQMLSSIAQDEVNITFVPHLLPINRGILATIYIDLVEKISLSELKSLFDTYFELEYFVRVLALGKTANIKNVARSNFCELSLHQDMHSGKIIIVSAIDNMVKGAAGQAIQNMNIVCNFCEITGLKAVPAAF
ncbi:MAG: N-acetyl-gamma-glutamyl-phosphate reductase [Culicoidibacterales bacterium]